MSPAITDAPAITPELRELVDGGVITLEQAVEAMHAAPAADEFMGFARCQATRSCESFQALRPVRLRRVFMRTYGAKPLQHMVLAQTEYLEIVNVGDDHCPDCGKSCALLPCEPPEIAASGF